MVIRTMSWHEKVGRCLFLLCCLTWASATAQVEEKTEAQTSPKGTFRIETVFTKAEDPADEYEQQYVVSTVDPNIREPLGEKHQAQPATYYISPDEQWIFAQVHYGIGMGGCTPVSTEAEFALRASDEREINLEVFREASAERKKASIRLGRGNRRFCRLEPRLSARALLTQDGQALNR